MLSTIASLVSASVGSSLMYPIELQRCTAGTRYHERNVLDQAKRIFPCKGIVTTQNKGEIHNGIATRATMQAMILRCSLAVDPCLSDVIKPLCGPFAGTCYRINDGASSAIQLDGAGSVYTIELVA